MVEEVDFKQWRDAGHVARRTLEGIKGEVVAGKTWNEVIDSAERFIRRHGGQAAFPVTISVNDIAAHYTTNHSEDPLEGLDREMIFQNGGEILLISRALKVKKKTRLRNLWRKIKHFSTMFNNL